MEGGLAVSFVFIAGIVLLSYHLYKKGNIVDLQEFQGIQYTYGDSMSDNAANTGNMAGTDSMSGMDYTDNSTGNNSNAYGTGNTAGVNGIGDNIYSGESYTTEDGSIIINKEASVVDSNVIKNNNASSTGDETSTNKDDEIQKTTFNQDYFKD